MSFFWHLRGVENFAVQLWMPELRKPKAIVPMHGIVSNRTFFFLCSISQQLRPVEETVWIGCLASADDAG